MKAKYISYNDFRKSSGVEHLTQNPLGTVCFHCVYNKTEKHLTATTRACTLPNALMKCLGGLYIKGTSEPILNLIIL